MAIYNPSMRSPLHAIIVARIRECGPITMAEYMELALYHQEHGYSHNCGNSQEAHKGEERRDAEQRPDPPRRKFPHLTEAGPPVQH